MSDQPKFPKSISEVLHPAFVEADALLTDSVEAVQQSDIDEVSVSTAILSLSLALITQMEQFLTSHTKAVNELTEAVRKRCGDVEANPTEYESEIMFAALKANWVKKHPENTDEEYRQKIARFEKIAGL